MLSGQATRADHNGEVRWCIDFDDGVIALVNGEGDVLMRGWRSHGRARVVVGRDDATGKYIIEHVVDRPLVVSPAFPKDRP